MTKVISLSELAYKELKTIKGKQSFSEVVLRLVGEKKKKSIMEFFGTWPITEEKAKRIKDHLARQRKKVRLRGVTF